jgi:hypothetical protein
MGGFCKNVGKYGSLSKLWEIWEHLTAWHPLLQYYHKKQELLVYDFTLLWSLYNNVTETSYTEEFGKISSHFV